MPDKFNELLLKQDIIELYNAGITADYGYLMNGRFEKDMVKMLYPLKTLSGNPISWEASETEYLFPTVSFQPKQAGSGDPSPENIRPISGWDKVQVTRCGKNLLPISSLSVPVYNTLLQEAEYPSIYKACSGLVPGSSLRVSALTTYEDGSTSNAVQILIQYEDGSSLTIRNDSQTGEVKSFTVVGVRIYTGDSSVSGARNVSKLCLVYTQETNPTYEPYQGDAYDIALPETVYGGTVDAVTGVGNDTWYYKEFDGQENWSVLENDVGSFFYYGETSAPLAQNVSDGVCSHFVVGTVSYTSNDLMIQIPYTIGRTWRIKYGAMGTADEFKAYLAAQASAGTPVQVAYKVTTREPFQATGNRQLTSLAGYNTIYTTGDSITLSRKIWRLEV